MMVGSDRPWMTALEMQFVALATARRSVATASRERHKSPCFHAEVDAVRLLPSSETFEWSADTARAVWAASASVPDDAVIDTSTLLHSKQPQWWWFDWPLPIPMDHPVDDDELDAQRMCALLVESSLDGGLLVTGERVPALGVSEFRMTKSFGPALVSFQLAPDGKTLRDVLDGSLYDLKTHSAKPVPRISRGISVLRFILAASVWLNQRIIIAGSGAIERHRRKQLAREHDAHVSDVKVITLRRAESQSHEAAGAGDLVEWSCRWIVNGHWRNQFHPSTGKHELKYILPYVKGPDDKPLKVPTHTVYAVTR